jgi:hypothetical protein
LGLKGQQVQLDLQVLQVIKGLQARKELKEVLVLPDHQELKV